MDSLGASLQSPEDVHSLSGYAQTILPEINEKELPSLILTSHGQSPPLNPAPDLRINVRNLPNPPKHIRDSYNGTSKRLQEWMMEDPVFVARRDAIRIQIEAAMSMKMDEDEKREGLKLEPKDDQKDPKAQLSPTDLELSDEELDEVSDRDEDADEHPGSSSSAAYGDPADNGRTLRVGIFCAMGRHRSVAMVEELSKTWPGWQVKVEHRDISKKRGEGKKAGGRDKRSRGTRGGTSSFGGEDYE